MDIENRDGIALLRLDEGKANAIDGALIGALDQALERVEREQPSALVITGTGRHFCAGLDLVGLSRIGPDAMDEFLLAFERAMVRLFLFPLPVVAAVNGSAIAGGCLLAGAADWRVAALGDYKVGINEARIGVSFPSIALEIARFLLPPGSFRKTVLEGDLCSPAEAAALGWFEELCSAEQTVDQALARARRLARTPRAAFALCKREMRAPYAGIVAVHGQASRAAFRALWFSSEAEALRRAVLEKKR